MQHMASFVASNESPWPQALCNVRKEPPEQRARAVREETDVSYVSLEWRGTTPTFRDNAVFKQWRNDQPPREGVDTKVVFGNFKRGE